MEYDKKEIIAKVLAGKLTNSIKVMHIGPWKKGVRMDKFDNYDGDAHWWDNGYNGRYSGTVHEVGEIIEFDHGYYYDAKHYYYVNSRKEAEAAGLYIVVEKINHANTNINILKRIDIGCEEFGK